MCEPVTMAAIGGSIAAGQGGLSIIGDEYREDAEFAYQRSLSDATNKQMAENNGLALESYIMKVRAEQQAQMQEEEALAEQSLEKRRETRRLQSSAEVAASDSGIAGNSLNNILQDYSKQEAFFINRIETQQKWAQHGRDMRVGSYRDELKGRVNSIKPYVPTPIKQVDYLSPILGVGQGAMGGFAAGGGGLSGGQGAMAGLAGMFGGKDKGAKTTKSSGSSSQPWYSDGDA